MTKRLRLLLLALVTALLAAEAMLQLGYFVTWRYLATMPAVPKGEGPLLLCIGDSFTYGVGASSPEGAYPEQLGARLQSATDRPWRVANRGWPGWCSRQLLEGIDGWLAETRPQLVCIAVGVNDTWQLPQELVLPPAVAGSATAATSTSDRVPYVWTCRLLRLVTTFRVTEPFRDATPATGTSVPVQPAEVVDALVGSWQVVELGLPLRLLADGTGTAGDLAIRWHGADAALTLLVPPLQPLLCEWRSESAGIELRLAGTSAAWHLRPVAASATVPVAAARHDWRGEGDAAMRRRDWATALAAFRAALDEASADSPAVPAIRFAKAQAHVELRQQGEALAELQHLRSLCERRPDAAVAEAFVQCLILLRREAEAEAVLERVLPYEPPSPFLWATFARLTPDRARAREAIGKAIVHAGALGWRDRSFVFLQQAQLHADAPAPDVFAQSVVAAYCDDPHRERTRQVLSYWRGDVAAMASALQSAGAQRHLDAATTSSLVDLLREAKGDLPESWQRTYKSHIVQMIERIRAAGAEPVLVGYPFGFVVHDLQRQIAEQQRCLFVPNDAAFRAVKTTEPQRVLLVADGHCNDDGYGIMATEVARALVARWAAAPDGPAVRPAGTK